MTTSTIVCSACKREDTHPRLLAGDPHLTCNRCGRKWKALEIPVVRESVMREPARDD